MAQNSK